MPQRVAYMQAGFWQIRSTVSFLSFFFHFLMFFGGEFSVGLAVMFKVGGHLGTRILGKNFTILFLPIGIWGGKKIVALSFPFQQRIRYI
jgi:hypothetical protein